jgi:hypothetical protein
VNGRIEASALARAPVSAYHPSAATLMTGALESKAELVTGVDAMPQLIRGGNEKLFRSGGDELSVGDFLPFVSTYRSFGPTKEACGGRR